MLLQGPVGSPYPGKYVMFAFAAFLALMTWRFSRSAIRARRKQRNDAALGISVRPDPKKSGGAGVTAAVLFFLMLVAALAAIYKAWPN